MTENENINPIESQEGSGIADKFQKARESVIHESQELSEIYRAMSKPGAKDVYNAWVKNMDVVANTYSWGKDKTAFKTHLIKACNRLVGVGATVLTVPTDLIVDTLTFLPRKLPIIRIVGQIIPTNIAKRLSIRSSEYARNQALVARGIGTIAEVPGKVVGGVMQSFSGGFPEVRAGVTYAGKKVGQITEAILNPKLKK